MEAVPQSVRTLSHHCDFCCRVVNADGQEPQLLREPGAPHPPQEVDVTWKTIQSLWENPDKDGDGRLSKDELADLRKMGRITTEVIKSMDTDGDGELSPEEFAAAAVKAREHGSRNFK